MRKLVTMYRAGEARFIDSIPSPSPLARASPFPSLSTLVPRYDFALTVWRTLDLACYLTALVLVVLPFFVVRCRVGLGNDQEGGGVRDHGKWRE